VSKLDKFNEVNDKQSINMEFILRTLLVMNFSKFNELNVLHPENIDAIFVTLVVSKFETSKVISELQSENIFIIFSTKEVLKLISIFNKVNDRHPLNIFFIVFTFDVSKFKIFNDLIEEQP
jgi:hypothetical protein